MLFRCFCFLYFRLMSISHAFKRDYHTHEFVVVQCFPKIIAKVESRHDVVDTNARNILLDVFVRS